MGEWWPGITVPHDLYAESMSVSGTVPRGIRSFSAWCVFLPLFSPWSPVSFSSADYIVASVVSR